jgi:hypothetical protein
VKRWERWTFNLMAAIVAVTGFVYLWMKYGLQGSDPFAVVNHPWQGAILNVHVLASPALILMFGIVLNSHVMRKLRAARSPNRTSGLLSFVAFAGMVLSGYLLQVATSVAWLQALVVVHVATGTVFAAAYAAHLVVSIRLARAPQGTVIREVA